MASTHRATDHTEGTPTIALVGGGPAALVAAIALAPPGIRTAMFERDPHPEIAPRFNPDRTIDISGHGLKALRHIDAWSDVRNYAQNMRDPERNWSAAPFEP